MCLAHWRASEAHTALHLWLPLPLLLGRLSFGFGPTLGHGHHLQPLPETASCRQLPRAVLHTGRSRVVI